MEKKNCKKSELLRKIRSLTKEELEKLVESDFSGWGTGTGTGGSGTHEESGLCNLSGIKVVGGLKWQGSGFVFCSVKVKDGKIESLVSATFSGSLSGETLTETDEEGNVTVLKGTYVTVYDDNNARIDGDYIRASAFSAAVLPRPVHP